MIGLDNIVVINSNLLVYFRISNELLDERENDQIAKYKDVAEV